MVTHTYVRKQADASEDFDTMLQCLGTPPLQSSARFNPDQLSAAEAVSMLQSTIPSRPPGAEESTGGEGAAVPTPKACPHPTLRDVVVVDGCGPFEMVPHPQEVTVGLLCGMAGKPLFLMF